MGFLQGLLTNRKMEKEQCWAGTHWPLNNCGSSETIRMEKIIDVMASSGEGGCCSALGSGLHGGLGATEQARHVCKAQQLTPGLIPACFVRLTLAPDRVTPPSECSRCVKKSPQMWSAYCVQKPQPTPAVWHFVCPWFYFHSPWASTSQIFMFRREKMLCLSFQKGIMSVNLESLEGSLVLSDCLHAHRHHYSRLLKGSGERFF